MILPRYVTHQNVEAVVGMPLTWFNYLIDSNLVSWSYSHGVACVTTQDLVNIIEENRIVTITSQIESSSGVCDFD